MNSQLLKVFILTAALGCLLSSCSEKQKEFERIYQRVIRLTNGDELTKELKSLEHLYPAQAKVKIQLGAICLAKGELEEADKYLTQAEGKVKRQPDRYADKASLFQLYETLALLQFAKRDYQRALGYAERSFNYGTKAEQNRVRLFRARCLYLTGKKDEAYLLYNLAWQEQDKEALTHDDLIYFSNQALKRRDYERAVAIMNLYQERFPYNKGHGGELAKVFAKRNEEGKALLARAMDWEYMAGMVLIHKSEILRQLDRMEKGWSGQGSQGPVDSNTSVPVVLLIRALKAFFQENYRQTAELLQKLPGEFVDFHFYDYVLLASRLESAGADTGLLARFEQLKNYYKNFPSFYQHYWQGMKKSNPDYAYTTAKDVLERCILLAPYTPAAVQARLELGRLLDLTPADSHLLLLNQELDDLLSKVMKEQDFALLMPVLKLLTLPPNEYQQAALTSLQQLAKKSLSLRIYLEEQRLSLPPQLQTCIGEVLGG